MSPHGYHHSGPAATDGPHRVMGASSPSFSEFPPSYTNVKPGSTCSGNGTTQPTAYRPHRVMEASSPSFSEFPPNYTSREPGSTCSGDGTTQWDYSDETQHHSFPVLPAAGRLRSCSKPPNSPRHRDHLANRLFHILSSIRSVAGRPLQKPLRRLVEREGTRSTI